MKTWPVVTTAEADEDAKAIVLWWVKNRSGGAPGLRLSKRAAKTRSLDLLLRLLAVATVSLSLARCDCGGDIRAADYDQSCDVDEHCAAVADGNKCDIERCGCPFTGINAEELERFQRDLDQIPCVRNPLGGVQCSCINVEAACDEGSTCGVRRLE